MAYSESISAYFAELLDETTTGQAWVRAKQRFASGLFSVTPYHTKSMNEFIFYGLPMFQTETAAATGPVELPAEGSGPAIGGDPLGSSLPVAKVSVQPTLALVDTPEGDYYEGDGGTLEVRGRAITALTEIDVTRPDGSGGLADRAVGVVVTGLTSEEVTGFSPLFFNPTSGYTGTEDRPFVSDSTFPAGLARLVTYVDGQGQERQKVVLAATRFRPGPQGDTGTLEKYTGFELDVYYENSPSADVTAPLIDRVEGVSDGEIAYFEVVAIGDGLPDDTQRVNVLFAPSSGGVWKQAELVRVSGTNRWVGGAPVDEWAGTTEFVFWVQACDTSGNCGASTAKGVNFLTADSTSTGVSVEVVEGTKADTSSEWYVTDVTARATTQVSGVELDSYVLDGEQFSLSGTSADISVANDGAHFLVVEDTAGNRGSLLVAIDKTAPTADLSSPSGTSFGVNSSPEPSVPFECVDVLSGIASCTATITDSSGSTVASATGAASGFGVSSGTIDLPTSTLGDFTLSVTATDAAGNEASPATYSYSIVDTTPPTITITTPTDGASYATGETVFADYSCSDDSGVAPTCEGTLEDGTSIASGGAIPMSSDDIGTHTLTVTSTDASGNTATASVDYVVAYAVCLLYDPAKAQPSGGTVPIKLQICDAEGTNLSKSTITVTAVALFELFDDGTEVLVTLQPQDSGKANTDPTFDFRYDSQLKGYIYNLDQELDPGSYAMEFVVETTGDATYRAPFQLK